MTEPNPALVASHPCVVWTAQGFYHSRYQTMICAARTVVFLGGGVVIDDQLAAWDRNWDFARCKQEVLSVPWERHPRQTGYAY